MMNDLISYTRVSHMVFSLEIARKRRSVAEIGVTVLLRLFELEPRTKKIFGYSNVNYEDLSKDFQMDGKLIISMLDSTLLMLGPDTDGLEEALGELGTRHGRFGVRPEHFALMGHAVRLALSEILGSAWTKPMNAAWRDVFDELARVIVAATKSGTQSPRSSLSTLPFNS